MTATEAWRGLDCVARCAYLEIAARYAGPGSNNGRIPYSVREMAEALNVGKMTAGRALQALQDRGFIVLEVKGEFSVKVRQASEWRLTEHADDRSGALASREFARWRNPKDGARDDTARSL